MEDLFSLPESSVNSKPRNHSLIIEAIIERASLLPSGWTSEVSVKILASKLQWGVRPGVGLGARGGGGNGQAFATWPPGDLGCVSVPPGIFGG